MTCLPNLRKAAFWAMDFAGGSPVRGHLDDLRRVSAMSGEDQRRLSLGRAEEIARYARENVPFYAGIPDGTPLGGFPVVNKTILRENLDRCLARGMRKEKMRCMLTSGSTGTPFASYLDRGKQLRAKADIIHWGAKAGYELGERLFYMRVWTKTATRSRLGAFLSNIEALDISSLSDESLDGILKTVLGHRGPYAVLGYVSSLEAVSRRMTAAGTKVGDNRPSGILAMSESLDDGLRARLREQFGVWPALRYSNMENGLVAQQPAGPESHYVLNHGSFHVEILDQKADRPVPEGELGRIVITDLFNRGMPFIRYDTGDLGTFARDAEGRLVLGKVEGRRWDQIFDTKGRQVSSATVALHMWSYPEVVQYQFIQRGENDYLLKLNLPGGFHKRDELLAAFRGTLGEDANLSIEMVDEIPLLESGKRKKVMNLMSARGR